MRSRKITAAVLFLAFIICLFSSCTVKRVSPDSPLYVPAEAKLNFTVNIEKTGKKITNQLRLVNCWDRAGILNDDCWDRDYIAEKIPFVETVEIMTATGGNAGLDLFKDPLDYSVRDDYDFSELILCCEKIVALDLRPSIKLANIPLKITNKPFLEGGFGVTVLPPEDINEYYDYLHACISALAEHFGKETVAKWRFVVFTEFDNAAWIQCTDEEFYDIYDCSVAAVESVLGKGVEIGAHAEFASPRAKGLLAHCATGTNRITGEDGVSISFLDFSYYTNSPYNFNTDIGDKGSTLITYAEYYGLSDLRVGVGEGRILFFEEALTSRITGKTYQAAFDTRTFIDAAEKGIDYVASWPAYTTRCLAEGVDNINLINARLLFNTVGLDYIDTTRKGNMNMRERIDAFAAYDEENETFWIGAYDMALSASYKTAKSTAFNVSLPWKEGMISVEKYVVDDSCNYFDEFRADLEEAGYTTGSPYNGGWSTWSTPNELNPTAFNRLFVTNLEKYAPLSHDPIPTSDQTYVTDGTLKLYHNFVPDTTVYYKVILIKDQK